MLSNGLKSCHWLVLSAILLLVETARALPADEHSELSVSNTESESPVTVPDFVATSEWQELLPDQVVPRGLHIRLNMETGKREAKMVETDKESEEHMRAIAIGSNAQEATISVATDISGNVVMGEIADDIHLATDEGDKYDAFEDYSGNGESNDGDQDEVPPAEPNWNHEKMYEVLQALPEPPKIDGMDIHLAHDKLTAAEFRNQIVTLWKRRQAELKVALESLQDDAKYLGKLLQQLNEAEQRGDTDNQLSVLEVLEWEVQDLDKTHVFNYIGGFGVVAKYLNSTILPVRASVAWVIGSAVKNYRDGQEWAIDAGCIPLLIESLKLKSSSDKKDATDVLEVKKKSIYALSSIIRANARGQRLFLLHDGPGILAGIFNDAYPAKLQLKVLFFVYDLMVEASAMSLHHTTGLESALINLAKTFQSLEWCERFSTTFVTMAPQLAHRQVIELVDALRHQLPKCQQIYQVSGVKSVVGVLSKRLTEDAELDAEEKKELAMLFEDFQSRL
ncbi:RxLR-like protein [Plasmopara halstedii]|uniref:RxLR-like protein n=1 Tax=Plasmopara halstedii TaxID=4781 RepID=A0A0P1B4Y1_PLAHL|nr:RxLR-like protein [Plasmopara halstedii]CEG49821.1 RxLR-like protein [Plasmopara halstedii]|eukprot:XP_024586190.1 RxLR-like protein [Plasmopara halstedii]